MERPNPMNLTWLDLVRLGLIGLRFPFPRRQKLPRPPERNKAGREGTLIKLDLVGFFVFGGGGRGGVHSPPAGGEGGWRWPPWAISRFPIRLSKSILLRRGYGGRVLSAKARRAGQLGPTRGNVDIRNSGCQTGNGKVGRPRPNAESKGESKRTWWRAQRDGHGRGARLLNQVWSRGLQAAWSFCFFETNRISTRLSTASAIRFNIVSE